MKYQIEIQLCSCGGCTCKIIASKRIVETININMEEQKGCLVNDELLHAMWKIWSHKDEYHTFSYGMGYKDHRKMNIVQIIEVMFSHFMKGIDAVESLWKERNCFCATVIGCSEFKLLEDRNYRKLDMRSSFSRKRSFLKHTITIAQKVVIIEYIDVRSWVVLGIQPDFDKSFVLHSFQIVVFGWYTVVW